MKFSCNTYDKREIDCIPCTHHIFINIHSVSSELQRSETGDNSPSSIPFSCEKRGARGMLTPRGLYVSASLCLLVDHDPKMARDRTNFRFITMAETQPRPLSPNSPELPQHEDQKLFQIEIQLSGVTSVFHQYSHRHTHMLSGLRLPSPRRLSPGPGPRARPSCSAMCLPSTAAGASRW